MPVNAKWFRYVYASIAKVIHATATLEAVPGVLEFLDDRSVVWKDASRKIESWSDVRTTELSPGEFKIEVDTTVILTTNAHDNVNAYDHFDKVGAFANALDRCIDVKDYDVGNTTPLLVGVLTPQEAIEVTNLKPGDGDKQKHSVIEARYLGYFRGT